MGEKSLLTNSPFLSPPNYQNKFSNRLTASMKIPLILSPQERKAEKEGLYSLQPPRQEYSLANLKGSLQDMNARSY